MGTSTMLGRSASVAQKSASPCLQLLNSSIQQQNVQPARGMANLKAIAIRLKSVKNIQKITQSMKMVSAAKYARAERDLKAARPYGVGAQSFYENAQGGRDAEGKVFPAEAGQKELYVALTSDRGLCGAIHSSICKLSVMNSLRNPTWTMSLLSVWETSLEPNWPGCLLKTSCAGAAILVACHPNSVTLPKWPAPS